MGFILLAGDPAPNILDIINGWIGSLSTFFMRVIGLLPDSFVNEWLTENNFDFLGYLNWFIPFYDMASITAVWLTAMIALFAGKVALRIGDKIAKLFK